MLTFVKLKCVASEFYAIATNVKPVQPVKNERHFSQCML